MTVLGIVAEYDPFHNGHFQHLAEARKAIQPDAVYVALSGCFRQRGSLSLLSPHDRALCALTCGADAVFALPVLWTVRDAEHYALGAVSLLSSLGATHLAFGAETANLSLLQQAALLLEEPTPAFETCLQSTLAEGVGYPAALSRAVSVSLPDAAFLLDLPNNILAVCYLRAIRRLRLSLVPVVLPRSGASRAIAVDPLSPSASAVQSALRRGSWQQAFSAMPSISARLIREHFLSGSVPDLTVADALLLQHLRTMTSKEAAALPDVSEGLDAALLKVAVFSRSAEELFSRLSGRRYSVARIRRLCACALLGISRPDCDALALPDRVLLLGLRKSPAITCSWKDASISICPTAADWKPFAHPADLAAWRFWAQCCRLPDTLPFTEKTVVVK